MKKILLLFVTLFLTGCGAEQITGTFTLDAAQGYVLPTNYETPTKYIIERNNDKVYAAVNNEGLTAEEAATWDEMTQEERDKIMEERLLVEDPLYDITALEATTEEIILEYEGKKVVFTAESDSYFITEDGVRYIIQYDSPTIAQYNDQLLRP